MISIRKNLLPLGLSTAVALMSIGLVAHADDAASKPGAKPAHESAASAKAKPQLSPELAALRDQVRQVTAAHQKQALNTQQNSATEIQSACLAFGCNAEVSRGDGQRVNGIACLCWNYPCAGFEMLSFRHKHVAARIGYGMQEHPGEFLAMLAMSRVPDNYRFRIGQDERKVADLVESEKLGCRSGSDSSLKLIGLAWYVAEPEWKNDLGETWSIGRLIDAEIAKPVATPSEEGLNRLMGISYAVARLAKHGQPIEGRLERAQNYVNDLQTFALGRQNADGSWGPYFLAARGECPDAASQLRSTGRVFEWLAMSLPNEKLKDPRVVGSVECLVRLLGSERYELNASSLSTQEIVSLGHALHALAIYDQRVFQAADAGDKPAKEPESATASRGDNSAQSR